VKKIWDAISAFFSSVTWEKFNALFDSRGVYYNLTKEDLDKIEDIIVRYGPLICLTRRKTHLTTYLISFISTLWVFIKTGVWQSTYWTHAFIAEDTDTFIEAVWPKVRESTKMEVLDVDAICLLVPDIGGWSIVGQRFITEARKIIGSPYDNYFDHIDASKVSCIEVVRISLICSVVKYYELFYETEKILSHRGRLTPDIPYDSPDFIKLLEIRR
jgi:hypothetical protein